MPSSRIPSLDGLRAVAISVVLCTHFSRNWHLPALYPNFGVRIFFVLSGFLITTLLIRERQNTGAVNLKTFYIRRAFRIFPAAYLYMIVVAILFRSSLSLTDNLYAFTYLSAYQRQHAVVLSHLWSLSVEEQFYLAWPAIMAASTRAGARAALAVVTLVPVVRFVLISTGTSSSPLFPSSPDALAMGCLLALAQPLLQHYRSFFRWRGFWCVWIITFALPIVGSFHSGRLYQCVVLPVLHLGIALCIQNAMVVGYRILNAFLPVWIGTLSYSLYLWHMPFYYVAFPANIALALLVAIISYYAVERPALRFRERHWPDSP